MKRNKKVAKKAAKKHAKTAKKPVKKTPNSTKKAPKAVGKKSPPHKAVSKAKAPSKGVAAPARSEAPPPEMLLFQSLFGFAATKMVSAAAKLDIADQLANGPKYYIDIAKSIGANQKAVHRLMRALASMGVFAETAPGTYALTPVSQLLRSNVPGSMRDMAVMITSPSHWLPWGKLEDTIKKGISVADEVFGKPLWDYFRDNEEEGRIFNAAMTSFSGMTAAAVAQTYDFNRFSKIVDVGGGHGLLLATLLNSAPVARGVLYDLPQVTKDAGPLLTGVSDRVEIIGGSFFDSVPEGGDCYVLKHIIHDWDDDRCVQILSNIRKAMRPDARVLVLDALMPDDVCEHPAFFMDMNMLAMTPGGCERTRAQFAELFNRSGLRLHGITLTPADVAIVEGVAA